MSAVLFRVESRPVSTRLRLKKKELPALEIRKSRIPRAGLGLFAAEAIKKGELITEYGGEVVDRQHALCLRELGTDSHLRSVTRGGEQALDGRVRSQFSDKYYIWNHQTGSYANGVRKPSNRNAEFINELGSGTVHPSGQAAMDRVFLKACRDIQPGDEILVNYGRVYNKLHLSSVDRDWTPLFLYTRRVGKLIVGGPKVLEFGLAIVGRHADFLRILLDSPADKLVVICYQTQFIEEYQRANEDGLPKTSGRKFEQGDSRTYTERLKKCLAEHPSYREARWGFELMKADQSLVVQFNRGDEMHRITNYVEILY